MYQLARRSVHNNERAAIIYRKYV